MIKVLYKLFLAVMLSLFIGFGIAVFYTAPKEPDYPVELQNKSGAVFTPEQQAQEATYEQSQREYMKVNEVYSRNVSAIVIAFSIVLLVLSLMQLRNIEIIGDGVLFGGLLTLAYGIIRGFMSNDAKYQFGVVTIGLIITLVLGYLEFIKPLKKKN